MYVLAANDPFVMSGWAIAQGLKDKVIGCFSCLVDPGP